jgi:hypothetical protein
MDFSTALIFTAIVGGLAGTLVGVQSFRRMPPLAEGRAPLRWLVLSHLLEPWLTLAWMYGVYRANLIVDPPALVATLLLTLPMLVLMVPWRFRFTSEPEDAPLVQLLGVYGVARLVNTWCLWLATLMFENSNWFFFFATAGTALLWTNVLHVRAAVAAYLHSVTSAQ